MSSFQRVPSPTTITVGDPSERKRKQGVAKYALFILAFVLLFCSILMFILFSFPSGNEYKGIEYVNIGEQPQCRLYSSQSEAYVFSPQVTTYQYSIADALELETELRNNSFKYNEDVLSGMYVYFNLTHANGNLTDPQVAFFHYSLSSAAEIMVLDGLNFEIFRNHDPIVSCILDEKSVSDWTFSYNGTEDIHIVVKNTGSRTVTITEEGWISKMAYKMDKSKALAVCQPDQECRFENTTACVLILDYQGEKRTVPVTVLYNYGYAVALGAMGCLYLALAVFVGVMAYVLHVKQKRNVTFSNQTTPGTATTVLRPSPSVAQDQNYQRSLTGNDSQAPPPYPAVSDIYGVPGV